MTLLASVCIALPAPMRAQDALAKTPTYDVVSIKPNKSGPGMMRIGNFADKFSGTNISLKMLIMNAYGLKIEDQISGLSGAMSSAGFDIEAKMDEDTIAAFEELSKDDSAKQRRLMLQALLADRFHLKIHHETRDLPMYSLVVAKGGFKLKEADPNDTYPNGPKGLDGVSHPGMMMINNGKLTARAIPISNLVDTLARQLRRPVTDNTGLKGKYDIALEWAPEEMPGESPATTAAPSGPSIYTALQEQLGLRLDSTKGPVDTIVVDHVELPSEN
jgi:uncharacterized protein (TIGR03435 family)